MVFKKVLRALGANGVSVDTVLDSPDCRPGGVLRGQVHIAAEQRSTFEHVSLGLATRMEVEAGDYEGNAGVEFHQVKVAGGFTIEDGGQLSVPFEFPVPWQTPVTHVYGSPLRGMVMGLRTELAIARAVDKGDLDPVAVHPLPAQEVILSAMTGLGFRFRTADIEYGRLRVPGQELPFYQEIEFLPPPQYAHGIKEVELTFLAGPTSMQLVLGIDGRRGGDALGVLPVDYSSADGVDWAARIDAWISQAAARYAAGGHGYGPGHGHGGHHERGGFGIGSVIAGAAAGIVGGLVAGEVLEEMGDLFGGDDGGE